MPTTLVSMTRTGSLTISSTPTAAARWKITLHSLTSRSMTTSLVLVSIAKKRECSIRWAMFSSRPVDRLSTTVTWSPRCKSASAS